MRRSDADSGIAYNPGATSIPDFAALAGINLIDPKVRVSDFALGKMRARFDRQI